MNNNSIQIGSKESYCRLMLLDIVLKTRHNISWIAKVCKVSPSTLHKIKNGTTRQPSPEVFRKILGLYCWCIKHEQTKMSKANLIRTEILEFHGSSLKS